MVKSINWYAEIVKGWQEGYLVYCTNTQWIDCTDEYYNKVNSCETCPLQISKDNCGLDVQINKIRVILPLIEKTHPEIFV